MTPNAATHAPRGRTTSEADLELNACNAAFDELELDWHGTSAEWRDLAGIGCEKELICTYLRLHRPHLLKAYDANALAAEIVDVKDRLRARGSGPGTARVASGPRGAGARSCCRIGWRRGACSCRRACRQAVRAGRPDPVRFPGGAADPHDLRAVSDI